MELQDISYDEEYYKRVMKQFGYDPFSFERFNFNLGRLSREELEQGWLCHHEGQIFAERFNQCNEGIVATGFGLSGTPHIGTLSQILRCIKLQKAGIPVSLVLGDLDAYNNKNTPLAKTQELAEKFGNFIIRLGFDNRFPSVLRKQINDTDTLLKFYLMGRYMDDDMLLRAEEDLYAGNKDYRRDSEATMIFRRKLSLGLMTADFLNLYFRNNQDNLMVMLGVDEHRFVRLAREVMKRALDDKIEFPDLNKQVQISGLYTKIIRGLNNYPKMSKSYPESGISVDLSPDKIRDLILNGEGNYDSPESNVVYQMICSASNFNYKDISKARNSCKIGDSDWTRTKKTYIEDLINMCSCWGS
jgi:tryptophanyl-tRNA synthetase